MQAFRNLFFALELKKALYIISTAQPIIQMAYMGLGLVSYGVIGLVWGIVAAMATSFLITYLVFLWEQRKCSSPQGIKPCYYSMNNVYINGHNSLTTNRTRVFYTHAFS